MFCPDPERDRIAVFDMLSDGRHVVHVGGPHQSTIDPNQTSSILIMRVGKMSLILERNESQTVIRIHIL